MKEVKQKVPYCIYSVLRDLNDLPLQIQTLAPKRMNSVIVFAPSAVILCRSEVVNCNSLRTPFFPRNSGFAKSIQNCYQSHSHGVGHRERISEIVVHAKCSVLLPNRRVLFFQRRKGNINSSPLANDPFPGPQKLMPGPCLLLNTGSS